MEEDEEFEPYEEEYDDEEEDEMTSNGGHGGGCCGISHIYEMTTPFFDGGYIQALIRRRANHLYEIVLAEYQMTPAYAQYLRDNGFRFVSRFMNANSGNECFIFHHHPNPLPLEIPGFDWPAENIAPAHIPQPVPVAAPVPPPAPREEPRVVSSTFHNVYRRSGRSENGWPDLFSAQARGAAAIRVDRKDTYASGAIRWHEGVLQ